MNEEELPNTSPLPVQVEEVTPLAPIDQLPFLDALTEVINGKKITRLEWNNIDTYGILKDSILEIHINNEFKAWTVSEGDMIATDWVVIKETF